jgi:predicted CXXCH cytochrome family protein
VNLVDPVPEAGNRFREPLVGRQAHIGCERCHGPGALHVSEQKAGVLVSGTDTAIVNPKRLPAPLREDVCRQCHLQGELRVGRRGLGVFDYRPGLPLGLFVTVFVRPPDVVDYHKSVGQVEQMAVSRCYAGSGGQLGCTSCHDPHASPAPSAKAGFYRGRCLTCHQDKGCSLPGAARQLLADACTACHMPKAASANIAHTAVTDHRILRTLPQPRPDGRPPGGLPIVVAPGPGTDIAGLEELDRDLGIALASVARRLGGDNPGALTADAVRRLTTATARHPSDMDAWAALAGSHLALGDQAAALAAAERAAATPLASDAVLDLAAGAAAQARRPELALEYARRAVAVNPAHPDYRVRLADILLQTERFPEAEAELRGLLDACPSHIVARTLLAVALHMQGRARDAVAEVERAARIAPPQSNALWAMFRSRIR